MNKKAWVADSQCIDEVTILWQPRFRRSLNNWAVASLRWLTVSMCWKTFESTQIVGIGRVVSTRSDHVARWLSHMTQLPLESDLTFPVPTKIHFFLWTTIQTASYQLIIWLGKATISQTFVAFTLKNEESGSHTLIHCPSVLEVWLAILCDFGMNWVIARDLKRLLDGWNTKSLFHRGKILWSLAPATVC